jgi:toxin-antitoxin system PIN domain toxin
MRALLDVNVWIALLDPNHSFAPRANAWFEKERPAFATCPIVENGVVRILASPGYSAQLRPSIAALAEMLAAACAKNDHAFWPDDLSLRDPARIDTARLHGPRQITDAYLLALAVAHGGCFVTFDGGVPLSAVPGAQRRHLRVI